jgi:hypothetical protein
MRRQGGRGHRQCVGTMRRQRQREMSYPSCGCPVYIYIVEYQIYCIYIYIDVDQINIIWVCLNMGSTPNVSLFNWENDDRDEPIYKQVEQC